MPTHKPRPLTQAEAAAKAARDAASATGAAGVSAVDATGTPLAGGHILTTGDTPTAAQGTSTGNTPQQPSTTTAAGPAQDPRTTYSGASAPAYDPDDAAAGSAIAATGASGFGVNFDVLAERLNHRDRWVAAAGQAAQANILTQYHGVITDNPDSNAIQGSQIHTLYGHDANQPFAVVKYHPVHHIIDISFYDANNNKLTPTPEQYEQAIELYRRPERIQREVTDPAASDHAQRAADNIAKANIHKHLEQKRLNLLKAMGDTQTAFDPAKFAYLLTKLRDPQTFNNEAFNHKAFMKLSKRMTVPDFAGVFGALTGRTVSRLGEVLGLLIFLFIKLFQTFGIQPLLDFNVDRYLDLPYIRDNPERKALLMSAWQKILGWKEVDGEYVQVRSDEREELTADEERVLLIAHGKYLKGLTEEERAKATREGKRHKIACIEDLERAFDHTLPQVISQHQGDDKIQEEAFSKTSEQFRRAHYKSQLTRFREELQEQYSIPARVDALLRAQQRAVKSALLSPLKAETEGEAALTYTATAHHRQHLATIVQIKAQTAIVQGLLARHGVQIESNLYTCEINDHGLTLQKALNQYDCTDLSAQQLEEIEAAVFAAVNTLANNANSDFNLGDLVDGLPMGDANPEAIFDSLVNSDQTLPQLRNLSAAQRADALNNAYIVVPTTAGNHQVISFKEAIRRSHNHRNPREALNWVLNQTMVELAYGANQNQIFHLQNIIERLEEQLDATDDAREVIRIQGELHPYQAKLHKLTTHFAATIADTIFGHNGDQPYSVSTLPPALQGSHALELMSYLNKFEGNRRNAFLKLKIRYPDENQRPRRVESILQSLAFEGKIMPQQMVDIMLAANNAASQLNAHQRAADHHQIAEQAHIQYASAQDYAHTAHIVDNEATGSFQVQLDPQATGFYGSTRPTTEQLDTHTALVADINEAADHRSGTLQLDPSAKARLAAIGSVDSLKSDDLAAIIAQGRLTHRDFQSHYQTADEARAAILSTFSERFPNIPAAKKRTIEERQSDLEHLPETRELLDYLGMTAEAANEQAAQAVADEEAETGADDAVSAGQGGPMTPAESSAASVASDDDGDEDASDDDDADDRMVTALGQDEQDTNLSQDEGLQLASHFATLSPALQDLALRLCKQEHEGSDQATPQEKAQTMQGIVRTLQQAEKRLAAHPQIYTDAIANTRLERAVRKAIFDQFNSPENDHLNDFNFDKKQINQIIATLIDAHPALSNLPEQTIRGVIQDQCQQMNRQAQYYTLDALIEGMDHINQQQPTQQLMQNRHIYFNPGTSCMTDQMRDRRSYRIISSHILQGDKQNISADDVSYLLYADRYHQLTADGRRHVEAFQEGLGELNVRQFIRASQLATHSSNSGEYSGNSRQYLGSDVIFSERSRNNPQQARKRQRGDRSPAPGSPAAMRRQQELQKRGSGNPQYPSGGDEHGDDAIQRAMASMRRGRTS
jgi:hypothetical protein